ncbi:MAG TPA: PAS domain S-box protein [Prolixibacteraceae bacterium]|nr:PAS domain S-box protein [Prolixibacteraceae bacterium]
MDQIYRILLVEDELYDAELNMREIKKTLPYSVFERVDNRTDYLKILKSFKPDIIISDYNMPSFDGLSALKIAVEYYPLTPFIVVTGSINEDTAVDCMKAGATDYVLKDSLKRLGSSVINALEQNQIRKERMEAFETIKLNEAKYRYMFHNNPQPMWIYDMETFAFLEVNKATIKHYGYTEAEFLSMTLNDIHPGCEVDMLIKNIETTDYLTDKNLECTHTKKNGDIIWVEVVSYFIILNQRNARHVLINDITERKKTEEKLISERKLLRTLIDNLPATIYVKDIECRKIIANRLDLNFMGVTSEKEVIGKTDFEIFNTEIAQRGYSDDLKVIDTGLPVINREEIFYDKSGELRLLLTSKIPLTDENEKIIGLVGIGIEITGQKLAQEKILKLSKGIEQSPTSIEITDSKGIVEYVNPRFCKTTGYSSEEIVGKYSQIPKPGSMPEETYADLWETISAGNVWKRELHNKKKDGTLFWELVVITSIKNDKGVITNYISTKEDITERKNMQAELIDAKERAEESDRLKSTFLANMSHEIRTPMNSIIGFSELLSDPDFDQEQKDEFIRTIVDNGNSLLLIISDIMDFSMLEACQMKIRKDTISTNKLLSELVNEFNNKAKQKGIELRIDAPLNESDILLESDLFRIKQIFSNLISNSLKFTHKGYIEIGYQPKGDQVEFHVKDTGIGIAPEFHQSIFERFLQVDTAKTRKYGGNGLGLAISKNLANLLGGNIWLESEPDKYSNFFFTIPINKS